MLEEAYRRDTLQQKVSKSLLEGKDLWLLPFGDCKNRGYLLYQNTLYIPEFKPLKLKLMQDHHDPSAAGYTARSKTLQLLSHNYH